MFALKSQRVAVMLLRATPSTPSGARSLRREDAPALRRDLLGATMRTASSDVKAPSTASYGTPMPRMGS